MLPCQHAALHAQAQVVSCLRCLWLPCRTRTDAETKREALLRELHELESKLKPMRCVTLLVWRGLWLLSSSALGLSPAHTGLVPCFADQ